MGSVLNEALKSLAEFNPYSAIFRILTAAVMGGCIGFERGQHGRAAGLRTHILVCMGATLTVMCGLYAAQVLGFGNDPMRVSAQVISGIGFLGAGTILTRNDSQVTGLTTAAGLWTTACIGISIGVGFYSASVTAFLIVMLSITVLTRLERGQKRSLANVFYLEADRTSCVNSLCDFITERGGELQIRPARSGMPNHIGLICSVPGRDGPQLLEQVREMNGVVIAVMQDQPNQSRENS